MLSLSLSAKYLPVSSHAPYRFHLIGLLILKESRGIRNLQHHTVVCKDSLPEPEELTLELLCQLEKCKKCDIKIFDVYRTITMSRIIVSFTLFCLILYHIMQETFYIVL